MGTGITDVIGGPHDFLPPRSDKFQKLSHADLSDKWSRQLNYL